ncbi:MAG: Hpt domain-containing protein, partial [Acidobacteriaceae bacterium]
MDDLTREFLLEAREGLDRMERGLTELESRPADCELLAEIFRSVHTIKGTTGFLGFPRLESLAHAGENLLGLLRDGRLVVDSDIISGLLALLDRLRGILRSIESTGAEGEAGLEDRVMIARLEALQRAAASTAEPVAAAASSPVRRSSSGKPRRSRSSPRVSPLRPPTGAAEAGPQRNEPTASALEPAPAEAASFPRPGAAGAPLTPATSSEPPPADATLRVDIELLNRIMNRIGELVLTRNQILQATSADAAFAPLGRRLDMVTADLREAVMKARMQPVSHVFSRFPRLVRDLARSLGKPVRLELEGQETELDKSLLEAIRDPLTHAIRNAVDHGIESAPLRAAAGKSVEGLVRLRARHENSHVIVEVQD